MSKRIIYVFLWFALLVVFCGEVFAATRNAASCERTAVLAAIAQATYGDTVTIPAGNCTWGKTDGADSITVTKYMTIQGAGSDGTGTNITQSIDDTAYALIKYAPDTTSITADGLFRVTAIKFNGSCCEDEVSGARYYTDRYTNSKGIRLYSMQKTKFLKNVRIDHCAFFNFRVYTSGNIDTYGNAVEFKGLWFGLVDNNYFRNSRCVYVVGLSYGTDGYTAACPFGVDWCLEPVALGTDKAVYIEDNYFYKNDIQAGGAYGGRWASRFNETVDPVSTWDVWDPHGGSHNTFRGMPSSELYCNKDTRTGSSFFRWAYLRGGTLAVWGNEITSPNASFTIALKEEDSSVYSAVPSVVSSGGTYYECKQNHVASASNKPPNSTYWKTSPWQTSTTTTWTTGYTYLYNEGYDPVVDSYSWRNYRVVGGVKTLVNFSPADTGNITTPPFGTEWFLQPNDDYWIETALASFGGTSGMAVGTAAQMAAEDTAHALTQNVGFWVTDEGTWNQSSGTNGYHNPLGYTGQGQLYRANASDTWVLYYTPYTYPHPLRGGTPPTAQDIAINGNNCTSLVQLQCTESTWPIDTKTMAVNTGVAGTCKYDTSAAASYSSMSNTFSTTGGISHSQSLTVDCGSSYSYYVKCSDSDPGINCLFAVDKDPPPRKTYNITELDLWKSPL